MVHYGFWGSKYESHPIILFLIYLRPQRSFTSPDIPQVNYPEGFQGEEIPIDGVAVAKLCHQRLALEDTADD
jgi:hypothetical protein